MTLLPEWLRLTQEQEAELDTIRRKAKEEHERARPAARRQGRLHFPDSPFECSWAFENAWLAKNRTSAQREARRLARSVSTHKSIFPGSATLDG